MQQLILSPITRDELKLDFREVVQQEIKRLFASLMEQQPITAPKYLTRKDTAKRLGVSLPTLNEWTKTGLVQGYRISSRIRYKESELDAALLQIKTRRVAA